MAAKIPERFPQQSGISGSEFKSKEDVSKQDPITLQVKKVKEISLSKGLLKSKPLAAKTAKIMRISSRKLFQSINPKIVGQDVHQLAVESVHQSTLSDVKLFQYTFFWPHAAYVSGISSFSALPALDEIPYSNDQIPQFDEKWVTLSSKIMNIIPENYEDTFPVYYRPEDYINRAQILLDRFFKYNPQFIEAEFKPYHPNLMLSALAIAHKVSEEHSIWNGEIANIVAATSNSTPPLREALTRDIHGMERLFLKGIEWNTSTQVPIERDMVSILFNEGAEKTDEETVELLSGKNEGDYLIRTKGDHYILAIKDGKIQFHEFTFDSDKNAVEILSPATEKEPRRFDDLFQLISALGGRNLIRNQPQKRTA
jgi:hypothetical protein